MALYLLHLGEQEDSLIETFLIMKVNIYRHLLGQSDVSQTRSSAGTLLWVEEGHSGWCWLGVKKKKEREKDQVNSFFTLHCKLPFNLWVNWESGTNRKVFSELSCKSLRGLASLARKLRYKVKRKTKRKNVSAFKSWHWCGKWRCFKNRINTDVMLLCFTECSPWALKVLRSWRKVWQGLFCWRMLR